MRTLLIIIFLIFYFIYSIPCLFVLFLIRKITKNEKLVSRIAQAHVRWAFGIICFLGGVKRNVIGLEKVPTDTPVLYVANHRGFFDIIVAYSCVPTLTSFVSKNEIEKVPLLNTWMRDLKCLFLNRKDIKAGMKTILTGIEQIKNGYSIFIMPEGTRNYGEGVLPFHEGSFKFAQKTNCPVIPVSITNTDDAFEKHLPWVRKTDVTIVFGDPVYLDKLSKEDKKFVGAYTQKIIEETLENIKSGMLK